MKKVLTNKYFIIGIVIFILLITCLIFIRKTKKMTNLEKIKVEETSNDIAYYLDEITEHKDEAGKYICFAIEYLYSTKDKKNFEADEVLEVINTYFTNDYDIEKLSNIGITPYMADKGIVFDRSNASYTYNKSKSKSDIAEEPIIKYELKKVKKISNKKFEAIFTKYVVTNPYKLLNYYNDSTITSLKVKIEDTSSDSKAVSEYLKGNEPVSKVKELINKDNINKVGTIEDDITIKYVIDDNKLKVEKIK